MHPAAGCYVIHDFFYTVVTVVYSKSNCKFERFVDFFDFQRVIFYHKKENLCETIYYHLLNDGSKGKYLS